MKNNNYLELTDKFFEQVIIYLTKDKISKINKLFIKYLFVILEVNLFKKSVHSFFKKRDKKLLNKIRIYVYYLNLCFAY